MARYARSEPFFPIMTLVVIAFIVVGFGSDIAARGSGYVPPPALVLHGAITLAWFALTLVQGLLIRRANFALHRQFGWASLGLAGMIVVLGYNTTAVAMGNPNGPSPGSTPLAPRSSRSSTS